MLEELQHTGKIEIDKYEETKLKFKKLDDTILKIIENQLLIKEK